MTLDAIKARAEAATPGPWEEYDSNEGTEYRPMWCVANEEFHNPSSDEDAPWIAVELHTGIKADAEFIAAARSDIPRLVAALEAVLELHKEVGNAGIDGCECGCGGYEPWCSCGQGDYPCPTVATIERALKEGQ